jgi:hypothetical protein
MMNPLVTAGLMSAQPGRTGCRDTRTAIKFAQVRQQVVVKMRPVASSP